jgi:hypothetical protein
LQEVEDIDSIIDQQNWTATFPLLLVFAFSNC